MAKQCTVINLSCYLSKTQEPIRANRLSKGRDQRHRLPRTVLEGYSVIERGLRRFLEAKKSLRYFSKRSFLILWLILKSVGKTDVGVRTVVSVFFLPPSLDACAPLLTCVNFELHCHWLFHCLPPPQRDLLFAPSTKTDNPGREFK